MTDASSQVREAALVISVPEVEPLVGPARLQYDPSAAVGVPAHITINYPFLPALDPSDELVSELANLFAGSDAFEFTLQRLSRFPDVLYLPPEPDAPFRRLIELVAARFPDSPPYGGEFDEVVPHLTIAQTGDESVLSSLEARLARLAVEFLPISSRAQEVWLLENRAGRWEGAMAFPLGAGV